MSFDCDLVKSAIPICEYSYNFQLDADDSDCYRFDQANWIHSSDSISPESCEDQCNNLDKDWAFTNSSNCFCANSLISGFVSEESCPENNLKPSKLWNYTCDELSDYPEKHLYLRDHYLPHFINSRAVYECSAGYGFKDQENPSIGLENPSTDPENPPTHLENLPSTSINKDSKVLICSNERKWVPDPESLKKCEPIFCTAPPTDLLTMNVTYKLFLQEDISPIQTSLKVQCLPDASFDGGITEFEATCQANGWNVSNPVGCLEGGEICDTLSINTIRCLYPLCPEPEDEPNLDFKNLNITKHSRDGTLFNEVGSVMTLNCSKDFQTFKHPDTAKILQTVNVTCAYNIEDKSSQWKMDWNSTSEIVPECLYYCPDSPIPENPHELLENNWDGNHWSESKPVFTCKGESKFNIYKPHKSPQEILKVCNPFHDPLTNKTSLKWVLTDQETKEKVTELPNCTYLCEEEIPSYDQFKHNTTWNKVYSGLEETAKMSCIG